MAKEEFLKIPAQCFNFFPHIFDHTTVENKYFRGWKTFTEGHWATLHLKQINYMNEDLMMTIMKASPYIEAIATLLGALVVFFTQTLYRKQIEAKNVEEKTYKTYSERLSELTQNLSRSTKEVDKILLEMTGIAMNREYALNKLEADLLELEKREQDAKKRIKDLENVPLAVAEHFAQLTSAGEKRSARRDYFLFAAGVIVSTIVGVIMKYLGWA
jgi:DNA-binding ferritin-like protein (Dps family)